MNEKMKALLEMKSAMEHLRKAWIECLHIFSDARIDCNDYILGSKETEDEYPFHLSFDGVNVVGWIDSCLERIEVDLNE